ncbi:MAG: type IV toxin-antitoxin system AbiEi family antitoxin [Candidatus Sabulitectum sp.]|nr:type IV toxin-antitoxin system AbiEi family antitoxin [Candidatus Sabulitectum sp.]
MNSREYLDKLLSEGRCCFTTEQACKSMGAGINNTRARLRRLKEQRLIAEPVKSFHVIVMPEYRSQGCPPAEHFIDQLMNYQGNSNYYVCLLSAAEKYGAGHQRPQQFQVMIEKNRRDIHCDSVLIKYIARGTLANVPVSSVNSPWGTVRYATPEVTALELLGYPGHSGGLNNAVTVILDLADNLNPGKLVEAVALSPLSWSQRLGYILETFGEMKLAEELFSHVRKTVSTYIPLRRALPLKGSKRCSKWKLIVNSEVEPDV